ISFCISVLSFFSSFYGDPPDLHSFPTRRSSDLEQRLQVGVAGLHRALENLLGQCQVADGTLRLVAQGQPGLGESVDRADVILERDRKSTRLNSSHVKISYAVFCLKKKRNCHETR